MAILLITAAASATDSGEKNLKRLTVQGVVEGYVDQEEGVLVWKGIPFAKPPEGNLRWRAPRDPEPWEGVLETKESQSECAQYGSLPTWHQLKRVIGSEDCLYLNVFRPDTIETNLPVYFWIHGGSNNFGSAKDYAVEAMANQTNMVIVITQYRVGPLGWFTHPAMKTGNPLDDSGNYGTLDHIKALEWVQANIEAFGGNPDNVTIAGESAGAANVMVLMVSPLAKGLFHRAVYQSGGMGTTTAKRGASMTASTLKTLLKKDGIDRKNVKWVLNSLSNEYIQNYLRNVNTEDILWGRLAGGQWMPTHDAYEDGTVIPANPAKLIESGKYNKVPLIIGSNEFEVKPFMLLIPVVKTSSGKNWADLYKAIYSKKTKLDDILPTETDKALYETVAKYGSLNWRAKYVDGNARLLRKHQDDIYGYLFKWGREATPPADFIFGSAHASEISFFMAAKQGLFGVEFNDQNRAGVEALQNAMMTYLAAFTRSGNPNATDSNLPIWESWSNQPGEPKVMILDADKTNLKLGMITEEVTVEWVLEEVEKLDEATKNAVKNFLW